MRRSHVVGLVCGCLGAMVAASANAQQDSAPSAKRSDADIIKSAMSAAPEAVSRNATIVDIDADGKMRVLRKGTNNFTCMPDSPGTPGPDPLCADRNAMQWIDAWANKKPPPAGKVGFMFMLAGGSDPSNTDPFAEKPAPNNDWVTTGPHVMIVGGKGLVDNYRGGNETRYHPALRDVGRHGL